MHISNKEFTVIGDKEHEEGTDCGTSLLYVRSRCAHRDRVACGGD